MPLSGSLRTVHNYRSQTIYMILGLMIGSLYAIIQGPTTLDVPQPPMNISTFHIGFFILGAVDIRGFEFFETHLENRMEEENDVKTAETNGLTGAYLRCQPLYYILMCFFQSRTGSLIQAASQSRGLL